MVPPGGSSRRGNAGQEIHGATIPRRTCVAPGLKCADPDKEPADEPPDPQGSRQFLHDNPTALFIDCRSEMEFFSSAIPVGAMP
jgi:hypothetical protein